MMTLYQRNDCPFCWKLRLALHELDLSATLVDVARGEKHPVVVDTNPECSIPVLLHNGLKLWESSVILDYIIDAFQGHDLLPGMIAGRARARQLQCYSDRMVGAALRGIIFEKRSKPPQEWDPVALAESTARWHRCLDWIELQVESGHGVLGAFSIADCALLPRFGLADHYGVGVDARHPKLAAWYEQSRRRLSFIATEPARPTW